MGNLGRFGLNIHSVREGRQSKTDKLKEKHIYSFVGKQKPTWRDFARFGNTVAMFEYLSFLGEKQPFFPTSIFVVRDAVFLR